MSDIVKNLDARDVATLNAIGKQIDTLTLTVGPDAPEIANLIARQNAIIAKGQSNLARAAELGSVQYGASKPVKERLAKENNLALAQRLAALEAAQKEG
jgi:capsule polysaccharide export protein KpsE/RkpR